MRLRADAAKLRLLADWFDKEQETRRTWELTEVQEDLRRIADEIEAEIQMSALEIAQRYVAGLMSTDSFIRLVAQLRECGPRENEEER